MLEERFIELKEIIVRVNLNLIFVNFAFSDNSGSGVGSRLFRGDNFPTFTVYKNHQNFCREPKNLKGFDNLYNQALY